MNAKVLFSSEKYEDFLKKILRITQQKFNWLLIMGLTKISRSIAQWESRNCQKFSNTIFAKDIKDIKITLSIFIYIWVIPARFDQPIVLTPRFHWIFFYILAYVHRRAQIFSEFLKYRYSWYEQATISNLSNHIFFNGRYLRIGQSYL